MPNSDIMASLRTLAGNFRWIWDRPTQQVFESIDAETWRRTRDPHEVLRALSAERQERIGSDHGLTERIRAATRELESHLADKPAQPLVGYFCMEHGVAPPLRAYAGGLGILAGDIEKTASDLNLGMVAVGLRYRNPFRQRLSYGWQSEEWLEADPAAAGLEPCPEGQVEIDLAGERLVIGVWRARIGRVDLFLLDTDVPENPAHLRGITDRLYLGDKEHRLRQELVLGVGGVRALAALGHTPTVFHANEGHAGFMSLERIEHEIAEGCDIDEAIERVRASTVFTTHTAVPAGFDLFERWLIEKYLSGWAGRCGVSLDWLMNLGHFPGQPGYEPFNMAVLCARTAHYINAVSRLHREVTERRVLGALWPGQAAPVRAVTNGVHPGTWTPQPMAELFERYVGRDWAYAGYQAWQGVFEIPDDELWRTRRALRGELVDFVRWYLPEQLREQGWVAGAEWAAEVLDPEALTIVVARRAADYKESDLLVSCPDRLRSLLHGGVGPVNVIFSGLAHPGDDGGKARIQRIIEYSFGPDVRANVVYLPGYGIRVAQALLTGADIWLNHPRRGDEACGTSFMKSVFCGGQILTTADGGADEMIVHGENGWIIGDRHEGASRVTMANDTFGLLEHIIVPKFYHRLEDQLPSEWLDGLKRSIATLAPEATSGAMMGGYQRLYQEAQRRTRRLNEERSRGRTLVPTGTS